MKKSAILLVASALCVPNAGMAQSSAQPNGGWHTTPGGLEYNIVRANPGRKAALGDVAELNVKVIAQNSAGVDSLLADSRVNNANKPLEVLVQEGQFAADWINGLTMLAAGDSSVFRVPMDSLLNTVPKEQQAMLPPFIQRGGKFIYEVSVVSLKSKDEYQKEMEAKATHQKQIDDKILQDYFAKNNVHPKKTASGLYYVIQKKGTGAAIKKGQAVSINYTGKTLDGKVFDSNTDSAFHHVEPITVNAGTEGQVIPGWTEGIMLMEKGTVATLYVPSPLGYGEKGIGPIAPNSILIFDMNVVDVK